MLDMIFPIMYTPLYVLFGNWSYWFWIGNIIGIVCWILFLIFGRNYERMFSKNKIVYGLDVLTKISKLNGKLEEFKEKINDKEFEDLLRNDRKRNWKRFKYGKKI